jgi:putative spermidine/putrescine transport system substrate-binding protein
MQTRVMIRTGTPTGTPTGCHLVRHTARHTAWALLAGLALVAGCKHERDPGTGSASSGSGSSSGGAAKPSGPIVLNVVDVAGTSDLVQDALEAYRTKHPDKVEKITTTRAPAPELPGKIKAMQDAGRMDYDLVLSGTDDLAAGIEQGLWMRILPDHADVFPHVLDNYTDQAR